MKTLSVTEYAKRLGVTRSAVLLQIKNRIMEKIAKKIKKETGINVLEKTRLSENVRAKREFIKRAAKKYNGSEIARFLNQTPESVYQVIRKWKN